MRIRTLPTGVAGQRLRSPTASARGPAVVDVERQTSVCIRSATTRNDALEGILQVVEVAMMVRCPRAPTGRECTARARAESPCGRFSRGVLSSGRSMANSAPRSILPQARSVGKEPDRAPKLIKRPPDVPSSRAETARHPAFGGESRRQGLEAEGQVRRDRPPRTRIPFREPLHRSPPAREADRSPPIDEESCGRPERCPR